MRSAADTSVTDRPAPEAGARPAERAFRSALSGTDRRAEADPAWRGRLRRSGAARFAASGLPGPRVESWRFTRLDRLADIAFSTAPSVPGALPGPLEDMLGALPRSGPLAVLVNGRLRPDLSRLDALPAGIRMLGLAEAVAAGLPEVARHLGSVEGGEGAPDRPFAALNDALAADGYVLLAGPGAEAEEVVRIVVLTVPEDGAVAAWPRGLIVADSGARLTVEEIHAGAAGTYLSAPATEVVVGDGARVDHFLHQDQGPEAFHMASLTAAIGRDAVFDSFAFSTGAALARNEIRVAFTAPGARARVSGAYLGRDRQHLDTTTLIDHAAPDCASREVYKGVLDDRARGVFQGKIHVARAAQRTDGHQMSRALLLSRRAEANTKPELEIFADDVKCSHGATTGQLDDAALFYLRSRGVGLAEARAMLIEAFLAEALDEVTDASVRERYAARARAWFEKDRP